MDGKCPVCNGPITNNDTVCPACGFKLLGSTQEFKPISYSHDDAAAAVAPRPLEKEQTAMLTIVRGPQIGTRFALDGVELTIGRSPKCDIFLNDMTVSRRHATIRPQNGSFVIKDCDSFNGIWVNNDNVNEQSLVDGDIVQVGTFCLLFES